MSRRASGDATPPTFDNDKGKSKYARKVAGRNIEQKTIQGFLDTFLALQHLGEHEAALDLTREAYAAAYARRQLFKIK